MVRIVVLFADMTSIFAVLDGNDTEDNELGDMENKLTKNFEHKDSEQSHFVKPLSDLMVHLSGVRRTILIFG